MASCFAIFVAQLRLLNLGHEAVGRVGALKVGSSRWNVMILQGGTWHMLHNCTQNTSFFCTLLEVMCHTHWVLLRYHVLT